MKFRFFGLFIALTMFLSCAENCIDENMPMPSTCGVKVKVVYFLCGNIFLEIQDREFYHLGDSHWQGPNGRTEKSVFAVTNTCEFGLSIFENELRDKEFKISPFGNETVNCANCLAAYEGPFPSKKWAVQVCTTPEQ